MPVPWGQSFGASTWPNFTVVPLYWFFRSGAAHEVRGGEVNPQTEGTVASTSGQGRPHRDPICLNFVSRIRPGPPILVRIRVLRSRIRPELWVALEYVRALGKFD